jgi:hypothetical protein
MPRAIRNGVTALGPGPRFPVHFLLYGLLSKRMPSHPHPVINEELPHDSNDRTASYGADAGCFGTGGDIP